MINMQQPGANERPHLRQFAGRSTWPTSFVVGSHCPGQGRNQV